MMADTIDKIDPARKQGNSQASKATVYQQDIAISRKSTLPSKPSVR